MAKLLGKKIGMSQTFDEKGDVIPITVLEVGPCMVLGKNKNNIIIGYQDIKENKLKKPQSGFFKKIGLAPKKIIREFPADKEQDFKIGDELKIDLFQTCDYVDVSGISIGKGFQGGVKRWGWHGGPKSHGSMSHRRPGSIGASSDPSRVLKGHRMPGHMGTRKVTASNLKIIKIQAQDNLMAVKGAIPGSKNGIIVVSPAIKNKGNKKIQAEEDKKEK